VRGRVEFRDSGEVRGTRVRGSQGNFLPTSCFLDNLNKIGT
jgi:hypothetical protein